MTYQVELTLRAEQDLDHILEWLTQRSPQGSLISRRGDANLE